MFTIDEGTTVTEYNFVGFNDTALNFAGEFKDSAPARWANKAEVNCEISNKIPGETGEVYTCLKGFTRWSPATVFVEKTAGSAVYVVKLVPIARGATPFDNGGLNHFKGSFNPKTGVLTWDKSDDVGVRSYNIAGFKWDRDIAATNAQTEVQIQGVKTKPGGTTLVAVMYWCVTPSQRFRIVQNGINNYALGCVWHPAPYVPGAGFKMCLESRMYNKRLNPIFMIGFLQVRRVCQVVDRAHA